MKKPIQGRRLVIRPVEERDLPYLVRWWNDGTVMAGVGAPEGLGITLEEIKRKYWPRWRTAKHGLMGIICLRDGTPIGETNLHDYNKEKNEVELGLKICRPDLWNRGLGTEALMLMSGYAFEVLRVERIVVNPAKSNQRIIRVNRKCGYRTVGERNGGLLMELTRTRWLGMKTKAYASKHRGNRSDSGEDST